MYVKLLSRKVQVLKCLFLLLFLQSMFMPPVLAKNNEERAERIVRGQVTDEVGEGIPGANVLIKGTTIGTITDIDGNFSLSVPNDAATLVFSFIGMTSQEEVVGARSVINVTLTSALSGLDEVVVVGFGTQKKESVVGSMSSITPSELKIPASNLTTALAGRVAGLVAYQTSGEPGKDNAQFLVRGVASFNSQNGPLILIDGVELTMDDLARLQPDDIESFAVLKDPTTTAIYGARGANGIILVTTKTGAEDRKSVGVGKECRWRWAWCGCKKDK